MVRHENDNDYHINLKLDSQYANLINSKNTQYEHGDFVVEVIPMDQGHIPKPSVGEHLTITGTYVDDTHHGWMEIHPAWIINGKGTTSYSQKAADISATSPSDEDSEKPVVTDPTQTSTDSIQVVSITSPISRGSIATLKAKVTANTKASITVYYNSGPSKSSSLNPKTSDAKGNVSWEWKVGSRTAPGKYKIVIECNGKSDTTYFTVQK